MVIWLVYCIYSNIKKFIDHFKLKHYLISACWNYCVNAESAISIHMVSLFIVSSVWFVDSKLLLHTPDSSYIKTYVSVKNIALWNLVDLGGTMVLWYTSVLKYDNIWQYSKNSDSNPLEPSSHMTYLISSGQKEMSSLSLCFSLCLETSNYAPVFKLCQ